MVAYRVTRVRSRVYACAAVAGDRHTSVACVAEASSLRADKRRVLAFLTRTYDGLARAPTCSCVALTFRLSKRCPSKTARRVDFFVGVLW